MKKQATNQPNNIDGRTKVPKSMLNQITAKKAVTTAHRVISKAADILEEEIAAGIIAAKELERKVLDVDKARDKDADHIMSRFRSDAHEVMDMLMDVVTVASTQLENMSKKLVRITADTTMGSSSTGQIPIIRNENSIEAGKTVSLAMQLQNESKDKSMEVSLQENDLMGNTGERILARNLKMEPATIVLKPGEKKAVKINVKVPKATKAGSYSGIVMDKKIPNLQAMLTVDVK